MPHDPYYDLITLSPEAPFEPKRTALLTIDLQYLDAHPSGWMGRLARDQNKPDHLKERFEFINEVLPNVRRLPKLARHTTLRTRDWPVGRYADTWRSAEIRFADEADFRAVHSSAEYQAIREDGFNVSVAAHHVSIYLIDQQWSPAS